MMVEPTNKNHQLGRINIIFKMSNTKPDHRIKEESNVI